MITLAFVMAFIGCGISLLIGIMIFSEVEQSIDCPTSGEGNRLCTQAKNTAWIVIGILPIAMFFALFAIFGGLNDETGTSIKHIIRKLRNGKKVLHSGVQTTSSEISKLKLLLVHLGLAKRINK